MSTELTELLESIAAPAMSVDAELVLRRGRRRRLRRLRGTAVVVVVAALAVPTVAALRSGPGPRTVPAGPTSGSCGLPDLGPKFEWDGPAGASTSANTWLDSGPLSDTRAMRVQVSTDTCEGLAVAVSHASGFSGTTAKISGRPREAFWVVDTVRDVDASGKVLTDRTTAVVLLPAGQRVCGIAAGSAAKPSPGSTPTLTDPVTTPTGHGWQATFAGMPSLANPQGATLRICAGSHVVEPALRPLNAITDPGPTPTGSAGTRADGVALQSVTCPSGTVNSGTVDRSAGASGVPGIRDLARGWAREAGLLDRFPDVVLTVAGDDRSTTATFVDHTGVRAELVFVRTADAWTLHELAYC